jgi:tape measure domain-containing protein
MAVVANIAVALTAKTTGLLKGLKKAGSAVKRMRRQFSRAFDGLQGLGGVVASVLSVRNIAQTADAWTNINNRIRTVTGAGEEHVRIQKEIFKAARRSRSGVEDFTDVFARIGNVNDEMGFTNDQIVRLTETAVKLGKIGGKSQEEVNRSLVQMSQAFATGIVRAEEFNSIQEGTPLIIREAARQMGLSMGELRMMMLDGNLAAKDFGFALLAASEEVDRLFAGIDLTIEDRITLIKNAWLELVGAMSESSDSNFIGGFLADVETSLRFLTEVIKAPLAALNDFKLTMSFIVDHLLPDWAKTILKWLDKFLEFVVTAFEVPDIVDRNVQAARFVGPQNPLAGQGELQEENSQAILEELKRLHVTMQGSIVAGVIVK